MSRSDGFLRAIQDEVLARHPETVRALARVYAERQRPMQGKAKREVALRKLAEKEWREADLANRVVEARARRARERAVSAGRAGA